MAATKIKSIFNLEKNKQRHSPVFQPSPKKVGSFFEHLIDLREVGPPPNAKRRQNSLNRLRSVCAGLCCKKNSLCCFGFLDIKIIFIGHSEVTQPPHILQIHPE